MGRPSLYFSAHKEGARESPAHFGAFQTEGTKSKCKGPEVGTSPICLGHSKASSWCGVNVETHRSEPKGGHLLTSLTKGVCERQKSLIVALAEEACPCERGRQGFVESRKVGRAHSGRCFCSF
jgi:hypothetical protein